jgi:hypothetical protein
VDADSYHRLVELLDGADRAYQRARDEVFSQVSFAVMLDPERLTRRQQVALCDLNRAETALAEFRADHQLDVRARQPAW